MFPCHTRCVLSRLLLNNYLSRTGRIKDLSCNACSHPNQATYHLILHCPATNSLHRSLFVSLQPLIQALKVARVLWLHGPPPCPPSLERGRVITRKTTITTSLNIVTIKLEGTDLKCAQLVVLFNDVLSHTHANNKLTLNKRKNETQQKQKHFPQIR